MKNNYSKFFQTAQVLKSSMISLVNLETLKSNHPELGAYMICFFKTVKLFCIVIIQNHNPPKAQVFFKLEKYHIFIKYVWERKLLIVTSSKSLDCHGRSIEIMAFI